MVRLRASSRLFRMAVWARAPVAEEAEHRVSPSPWLREYAASISETCGWDMHRMIPPKKYLKELGNRKQKYEAKGASWV